MTQQIIYVRAKVTVNAGASVPHLHNSSQGFLKDSPRLCAMGIYGFPSLHFEQKPHCTAAWSQNNSAKNLGQTFRADAKKTANMLS